MARIPVDDEYFLFRSCVASNKYPGMESSTKEVFERIGVGLRESDDQTCCAGFITFTSVAEVTATMPAVARNLSIPDQAGLNTVTMCNGCYTFLTEFGHFLQHNPPIMGKVNEMLSMVGREYTGESQVLHMIDVLPKLQDRIAEQIVRPLKGIRFATHYGCHYLYGFKKDAIDDPFTPTVVEDLIEVAGGTPVDYPEARTCCGSGLTQVVIHKEDLSLPHMKAKFDSLKEADVDAIVVVCPYCLTILDRGQAKMVDRGIAQHEVPVLYITQLLGLAMGMDPVKLGLGANVTSAKKFLDKLERLDRSRATAQAARGGVPRSPQSPASSPSGETTGDGGEAANA
jgi:heterodisulfide reductase subunit B